MYVCVCVHMCVECKCMHFKMGVCIRALETLCARGLESVYCRTSTAGDSSRGFRVNPRTFPLWLNIQTLTGLHKPNGLERRVLLSEDVKDMVVSVWEGLSVANLV